ncbi:unnamed protein product [Calypogeia fissa]
MGGGAVPSQEELMANRVPISSRDACANLLIPLNKCRVATYWMPWKCEDDRHSYEKCEYELFLVRLNKMKEIREGHLRGPQHAG